MSADIPSNPLTNLADTIDRHWRENRPMMYYRLKRSGELDDAIRAAADQTSEAVLELVAQGQDFWKAWELVREGWALLPAEGTEPHR